MGDSASEHLIRLQSTCWPGLQSCDGLSGAGGSASRVH